MKRLTKRAALLACAELWEWLAENPCKSKMEWPGWEEFEGKYGQALWDCPCCQYFRKEWHGGCEKCLPALWPGKGAPCNSKEGGIYADWYHGVDRISNALKIANAAKAELAKMKPLKNINIGR
jgi:hypothetical protein